MRALAAIVCLFLAAPQGGDRYSVRSEARELEVNTRDEVRFILEAVGEHTFDDEYPTELRLTIEAADNALSLSKLRLGRADAQYDKSGKALSWKVFATARKPGSHPVRANMKFRVCEEDGDCFDQTAELRITLVARGS